MTAAPAFHTEPTPGARNDAVRVQRVAAYLSPGGAPYAPQCRGLIPWQTQAARIITEHRPDRTGWRWPRVIVTVPRQSGKSTMMQAVVTERCIMMPGHRAYATAQTGAKARELWLEAVQAIEHSPRLSAMVLKVTKGAGDSKIVFRNGSLFAPFPPSSDGLDGKQCDTLIIDEAMAHSVEAGEALLGSAIPTQTSRPWRQTILISTRGGTSGAWFRDIVAQGEASIQDPASKTAIVEYCAPPDADPNDGGIYGGFHPGLGYTCDTESILGFREQMSAAEFKRAYSNRWDVSDEDDRAAIPIGAVQAVTGDWTIPPPAQRIITVDVAADQSASTIAAGWLDDGVPTAAVVARQPGTAWLAADLAQLAADGQPIIADPSGPTAVWLDAAELAQPVTRTTTRAYALACQTLHDRVIDGSIHLRPSPALTDALRVAAVKPLGGMLALDGRKSAGPIDAARAIALAIHATITQPTTLQVF